VTAQSSPPVVPPPASRVRRLARAALTRAARADSIWGAAVIGELDEAHSEWAAVRWAMSGLRVAWWERRRRRREAAAAPLAAARLARRIGLTALAVSVALITVNWLVATVIPIPSGSMEPAIWIGDRVLVDKLSFHLTGLHRGDVVVVAMSQPQPRQLIKRVVGLPGDRIECRADAVYRNGVPIPAAAAGAGTCDPVTVPAGSMYLLGDHVLVSVDSRRFGPVAQSTVVGRVVGRVWPWSRRSAADAS